MDFNSYGTDSAAKGALPQEPGLEEFRIQGYTVLPSVLDSDATQEISRRLDAVYAKQEAEFGAEKLSAIHELDLARCLLAEDAHFLSLATHARVLRFVRACLGEFCVLHLQNGVINRPASEHHQSAWHRDLPYQNYVVSKPIAVSAFWCVDPFTAENGGTYLLPFSHQEDELPSRAYVEKHAVQVEAPAGSVVLFNSMVFHRAGTNRSASPRRGINHVYTVPILKQQIDLPAALQGHYADDPALAQVLGYTSQVPGSVSDYRSRREPT